MNANQKQQYANDLDARILSFHHAQLLLPGIAQPQNRDAFIWQVIDSVQRVRYVEVIRDMSHSLLRANPSSSYFDPIKAAVIKLQVNEIEEACWLVFLATHCGKNLRTGWKLAAELYGGLGSAQPWNWHMVRQNTAAFTSWLANSYAMCTGKFGNHRKYESLRPGGNGTGSVVSTYVAWIEAYGSHAALFQHAANTADGDGRDAFSFLYEDMRQVRRFGRTGRFDYLTMLSKLQLAPIEAGSTYMKEATGPLRGARLLFSGQIDAPTSARLLEDQVSRLGQHLGLGMQVLEDSMCNWQKSPSQYLAFHG